MDCSPPGSPVHGILQARILKCSPETINNVVNWLYPNTKEKTNEKKNIGIGCYFLVQGIFPTQGSNLHSLMSPALSGRFFTTSTTWIFMYPMMDLFLPFQTVFPFQGSPSLKSLLNCPETIHIKNHNRTTGEQVKENRKPAGMLQV